MNSSAKHSEVYLCRKNLVLILLGGGKFVCAIFLCGAFLCSAVNFVHHMGRLFNNLKPICMGYAIIALDDFSSIY